MKNLKLCVKILLLIVGFHIIIFPAHATFISIKTQIDSVTVIEEGGTGNIILTNLGDEPAFDVSYSIILPTGFSSEPVYVGRLDQGESITNSVSVYIDSERLKPGSYPAALIVSYADANSYPFSSVSPFTIFNRERTISQVLGIIESTKIQNDETEKLTVHIKNPSENKLNLTVKLFLPKELDTTLVEKKFVISSSDDIEVDFEVSSFSALSGSTYSVFASLSYEEDGKMFSSFSPGSITIESQSPAKSNRILEIILILLIAVFLLYQLRKR